MSIKNPWEEISLETYEKHMSLDSVKQLQALNSIMKKQFAEYPVETAMILGVAGGNGLEHIDGEKYKTVYGIDICHIAPKYVYCVIQINTDVNQWVSDSPYLHSFDGLSEIHHQMEADTLTEKMKEIGFNLILNNIAELPNGKALVRLDYRANM